VSSIINQNTDFSTGSSSSRSLSSSIANTAVVSRLKNSARSILVSVSHQSQTSRISVVGRVLGWIGSILTRLTSSGDLSGEPDLIYVIPASSLVYDVEESDPLTYEVEGNDLTYTVPR
jgi:hypothetical protein